MSWLSPLKSEFLLAMLDDYSLHRETREMAQEELDRRATADLQQILDSGVDS